jgi:subtilisin family serine protease
VDAPEAWNTTTGNTDTVAAVVDEGVDINHPDLRNNTWTNPSETARDGVDNDRNGYVDDVNGWDFYNRDSSVYDPIPSRVWAMSMVPTSPVR